MSFRPSLVGNLSGAKFSIGKLFNGGKDGFWFDFQDHATLFEATTYPAGVSNGDTLATVVDKSKGISYGSAQGVTGWTSYFFDTFSSSGDDFTAEKTVAGGTDYAISSNLFSIEAFKVYRVELDVENVSAPASWGVDFGQTTNSRALLTMALDITAGVETLVGYISSYQTSSQSLRVKTSSLGEIVVKGARIYEVEGNHGYQNTGADRPTYVTSAPEGVQLDLSADGFDVTIPTGGFTGHMCIATDTGTATYPVSIPAGTYELGGNYFPALSSSHLVGVVMVDGGMTADEITALEAEMVSRGAVMAFSGSPREIFKKHTEFVGAMPEIDFSACTGEAYAICDGCTGITSFGDLDLSGMTANSLTRKRLFYGCSALVSVGEITAPVSATVASQMFMYCSSLTALPTMNRTSEITDWSLFAFGTAVTSVPAAYDFSAGTTYSQFFEQSGLTSWSASHPFNDAASGYNRAFKDTPMATFPSGMFDSSTCILFPNTWDGCALDAASVNGILVSLDTAGQSGGTLGINGGTNAAPDGSSGGLDGTTAKANLIGKGWTVTTN